MAALRWLWPQEPDVRFNFESALAQAMTRGGDARIILDAATQLNRYHSAPYPRDMLALASSTANDLSADAADFLVRSFGDNAASLNATAAYASFLEECRSTIRGAYTLDGGTDIFFAPSGTDLEYVGLFAVADKAPGGISNLLLGSDEVGSGCIHSAAGKYFANETALAAKVSPAQPVEAMARVVLGDFPVRDALGNAFDSNRIAAAMQPKIAEALAQGLHPLIHIVHGSKTGLVLPDLNDIDGLIAKFGNAVSFVVDACQARITTAAIHAYLARGIIVFLTGSKFMGGPPFSGFALLPTGVVPHAAPLPPGAAKIFRRAEVPCGWAGRDLLDDSGNAGLALRLAASLFELERFQRLSLDEVNRLVGAFSAATDALSAQLNVRKVGSSGTAMLPVEMQTLVTLDLCHDANGAQLRTLDFDDAARIHKTLIGDGIRLGQPVKCVKLADGRWGATLRIGVSMPQLVGMAGNDDAQLTNDFATMMARIGDALANQL
jgi:hypothetical protein